MMQSNNNNNNNDKSKHRNKESLTAFIETLLLDGKLQSWISNVNDLSDREVNLFFQILHDNQSLGINSSSLECAARRVDLFTPNQRLLLSSKASSLSTRTRPSSSASKLWMCLSCSHPNNGNDHCSKCNGSSICGVTKSPPGPSSMIWIKTEPIKGYRCHAFWIRSTHVKVLLGPNGKNHKSLLKASGVESIIVLPNQEDNSSEWVPVQVKAYLESFLKVVPMVQKLLETPCPLSPKAEIIWIPNFDVPFLIGPGGQNIKKLKASIPGIQTIYALQDYRDDEEKLCPVQILGETDKCVKDACKQLERIHDGVYKDSCRTLSDVIRQYNANAATPPNTPSSTITTSTTSPNQDLSAPTTKNPPKMISKVIWLYLAARDLQRLNGGNGTSPQEYKKPIVITLQGEKEGGAKVHACPQYMDKNNLVPFEIIGTHHQEIHQTCRLLEKTYGTFYHKAHCATLKDVITTWNETKKDEESSSPTPSAVTASPETVQSDTASVISEYDDEIVTDTSGDEEETTFHSVPSAPLELVKPINVQEESSNKMKENANPLPGYWWSPTPKKSSQQYLQTPETLSSAPIGMPTQTPLGRLWDESLISTPSEMGTPRSKILPSPVADTPNKQLFVATKDNPLYRFLECHKVCFRCTVDEFMHWLDSEDIQSLQDLSEALEQEDYVEKMKEGASFKKYMKDLFRNDLKFVLEQEPPPNDLVCPLSRQLFRDPVLASDGYTYELKWIETWIKDHDESPKTSQPLVKNLLIRNVVVQNLAEAWRHEQNVKKEEQEQQDD